MRASGAALDAARGLHGEGEGVFVPTGDRAAPVAAAGRPENFSARDAAAQSSRSSGA